MSAPRVTAATPYDEWPLFLTLQEVALVSGRSTKALQNRAGAGSIWPPPIADAHGALKPYRFHKHEVHGALTGTLPRPRRLVDRWRRRQAGARHLSA